MQKLIVALAFLFSFSVASAENEVALKLVQTITLPEVDGRIDHFAIDVRGRRAFLAALAKNTIEVVDLRAGRVTRTLPGFAKPQGVLFVPKFNKLVIASGANGSVKTLDGTTLAVVHTASVSLGADAIGYDPRSTEIYVGSGGSDANKEQGDLTVFNVASGAQVAALSTDAHAGGSVIEVHGEHVFVLVPEKAQVVVLDRKAKSEVAKWTIPGIQKNVALALDEKNHRLFLGVRTPPSIVVLDSDSGTVVASVPTVATLDGLSFDAATRRIYTSGGEGFVDVTQQVDADHYERIARIPTGPIARTSFFVPEWHRLYVAVPRDKERGAELRVFEAPPVTGSPSNPTSQLVRHSTMRPRHILLSSLCCASALAAFGPIAQAQEREAPPLREVQEIPLPGVQGRLDHFTIDAKRKRVIFSGLGNDTVQVVDVFAGRMIHQIDGLAEPQGTLYLAEWDKLFVANSADGHVNVYDGAKFTLLDHIDFGEGSDPDNLRYDAAAKKIYLGYGDGAIAVIDPVTNKRLPTEYKFEGHPEGFQLETKGPRIFVNVADTKNILVINRQTGKMLTWALPHGHSANFPMVLDEANRRVFIGTRKPSRLTVFDMDSGKVVASLPTAGDMDDMFYDADRKRIYVAGGEGFLSVVQQVDADHYTDMGKFPTALGTRTGVWYAKRDRLYIAAPPSGILGARLLVFEAQTD